MGIIFVWVIDQVKSGIVDIQSHPGQESLADYTSKHHDIKHNQEVRQWNIQEGNSPRVLPRTENSSALRGCVGIVSNGYNRMCPLPRIEVSLQHVDKVPCVRALVQTQISTSITAREFSHGNSKIFRKIVPILFSVQKSIASLVL